MRPFGHLLEVLVDDLHLGLIPGGSELTGDQSLAKFLLITHTDPPPVVEGSMSASRGEALLQDGIVDQTQLGDLVHLQTHGYAGVGEGVDKVHSSIYRIDDPGGVIGQLFDALLPAAFFLSNKPESQKLQNSSLESYYESYL